MPHKRSRADLEARGSEQRARVDAPCLVDRSPEAILWLIESVRAALPSLPLPWLRQALRRLRSIVSDLEFLVQRSEPDGVEPGRLPVSQP